MKAEDFIHDVHLALGTQSFGCIWNSGEPATLRAPLPDGDVMVIRVSREAGDPCVCMAAKDECECAEIEARRRADLDSAFEQLEATINGHPVVVRFVAPSGRGVKIDTRTEKATYL